MSLTVRFGLTLYVQDTIRKQGRRCLVKRGRPLLDYACRPEPRLRHWSAFSDPNLVQTLLLNGADPNAKFNGFSAWQNALYTQTDDPVKWILLLKLLLLHGADAEACIESRHNGRQTALVVIQQEFDDFLAGDARDTKKVQSYVECAHAPAMTEAVLAETLAQLKLDVIELKDFLINGVAKDVQRGTNNASTQSNVHGKVGNRSSKMYGERATLLVKRLLGRDRK